MNSIITSTKSVQSQTQSPQKTVYEGGFSTTDRFKKTAGGTMGSITLNSTNLSAQNHIQQIKHLQKSPGIATFYLQRSFGEARPVNAKPVNYANEDKTSHKKVELYLKSDLESRAEQVPPLTSLYDNELQPLQKHVFEQTEAMSAHEKLKRRQFINEKLLGDKRVV